MKVQRQVRPHRHLQAAWWNLWCGAEVSAGSLGLSTVSGLPALAGREPRAGSNVSALRLLPGLYLRILRPGHRFLLSGQFIQQAFGRPEIGGIESFREPAIDRREQAPRRVEPALFAPQRRQTRRRPQLPGQRALAAA